MSDIAVTDTAFTGFRVVREHPLALPFWAVASLVFSLAINGAFLAAGGKIIDPQILEADPAQAPALLAQLLPPLLATGLVWLLTNCIGYGAMYRAVLSPRQGTFGFLRVGGDELRVLGALLLLSTIFLGISLGIVILGGTIMQIAYSLSGSDSRGNSFVAVVEAFALFGVLGYLSVRLSLVLVQAFDTGRISLDGSWGLTRGHFWSILGTYLLATALTAVVMVLAWAVEGGVCAVVLGAHFQDFLTSQPTKLSDLFKPVILLRTILGAVTSALAWPLSFTPSAAVYKQLVAARGAQRA